MDVASVDRSVIICSICGNSHKTTTCNVIELRDHIQDNIVPSRARLTLPSILRIEKMSEGSNAIVAADNIKRGTQFGPFEAKKLFTLNPEITFPLKLFTPNDYFSEYYLDTSNENECNWMMFVSPAINLEEQNLICFQENLKIFFVSIRDISGGEYLKVWYSPFYAQRMNKDVLRSKKSEEKVLDLSTLLKKQQNLIERDIWTCRFCNLQERDVTKFALHISQHYSMQVRKACEICKSVFMTHKGLKKHVRIVHASKSIVQTKEYDNNVQYGKRKGDTRDSMLGGPLLNDVLTDSMDNTNLLLQQTDISRFDMQNIGNHDMLLDNDNLNLSVDNFIHDTDNFNFDIDEDKEQHICDICLKPFTKLKRLLQHLQKHTGKYTCSECLVIFSRNENLQAHKCNVYKKEQYKCTACEKKFTLKKYLSRHMQSIHEKKQHCTKCDKRYHCGKEFREHNCSGVPDIEKEKYPCILCNKTFYRESYMKKHMRLHTATKESNPKNELFICEICAKTFQTCRNLRRHEKAHQKLSNPCDKCDKSYTRLDSLKHHMTVEHCSDIFQYTCQICNKVSKSKKYLQMHMKMHAANKKYQCTACNLKFLVRSNMLNHFKSKHAVNCTKCKVDDCVHTKTINECYECPVCKKLVKLRSSLLRHIRRTHSEVSVDNSKINKVRRMFPISDRKSNNKNRISDDKNKDIVKSKTKIKIGDKQAKEYQNDLRNSANDFVDVFENFDKDHNQQPSKQEFIISENDTRQNENILDFNNIGLELDSGLAINNQEICLSMPELDELDQDVALSNSAYMLENGTIVEPLDTENVVVYIFDKK